MPFFPEKNTKEENPSQEDYIDHINQQLYELAKNFNYDHIQDENLREQLFMQTASAIMEFVAKLCFLIKVRGNATMEPILKDLQNNIKSKKELNTKFNNLMKGLDIKGL